jgi:hypothetical protein
VRIAVVSTPRSGNMWLRRLLVAAYGLEERSAHTPAELDWAGLPERCVLQLHLRRTPEFTALLARHGFRTAVLARHPLDVLVSILHFAPHEPQTARWLDGEAGDESPILGADPTSPEFLAYATGPRARALLAVTPEWWRAADTRVRYEHLVAAPEPELERVARDLGAHPLVPAVDAAASVRFADLQREAPNQHFWRGRPGLWRELIPAETARAIAAAQPAIAELGYRVDADGVTREQARARWAEL